MPVKKPRVPKTLRNTGPVKVHDPFTFMREGLRNPKSRPALGKAIETDQEIYDWLYKLDGRTERETEWMMALKAKL